MPLFLMLLHLLVALLFSLADGASDAKERPAKSILDRMESDALAFRDKMKRAHARRCDARTLAECDGGSHSDCSPEFPDGRCVPADELAASRCGEGCGGWRDETISSNGNSTPVQFEKDFPSLRNSLDYCIDNSFCASLPAEPTSSSDEQSENTIGLNLGILSPIVYIILLMGWLGLGLGLVLGAGPADGAAEAEEADLEAAAVVENKVNGLQDESNTNLGMSGNMNKETANGMSGEDNGGNDGFLPSKNVAQQGQVDESEHVTGHSQREHEDGPASESPGGSHPHALQTMQPSDRAAWNAGEGNPGSERQYSRQFAYSSTGTHITAGDNATFNFYQSSPNSSRQNSTAADDDASDCSDQTNSTLDRLNLAFLQLGVYPGDIDPIDAIREVIAETQFGEDEQDATQEATGPDCAHQPTANDILFFRGRIIDSNTDGYRMFVQEVEKFRPLYNTEQKPHIPGLVAESLDNGCCQIFDFGFDEQGRPLWIRMSDEREIRARMAKALEGRLKNIQRF